MLSTLLAHPSITHVHAYTRRPPNNPTTSPSSLTHITPPPSDPAAWPAAFPASAPPPALFLSALGTTRAAAGSLAAQRAIDFDLNLSLARAARDAGVRVYVLVSTAGADARSYLAYSRMKGELEDAVKELGFAHTVILRPGVIQGVREERRLAEAVVRGIAGVLAGVSPRLTRGWVSGAEGIARAGVRAGVECVEGRREEGVWEVGIAEIERLGREEEVKEEGSR